MKTITSSTLTNDLPSLFTSTGYHIDSRINKNTNYYLKHKKTYTLEQIFNNVETIQKQYEQILENPIASSCFFNFKQITKLFKPSQNKTIEQSNVNNHIENKSPFIFGGETLQWIALPQYIDHIYENELIN